MPACSGLLVLQSAGLVSNLPCCWAHRQVYAEWVGVRARAALLEAHAHCATFAAGVAEDAAAAAAVRAAQAPHWPRLARLWAALLADWAALGAGGAPPGGYAPRLLPAPVGPLLPAVLPYLARAAPPALRALGALAAEDAGRGVLLDGDTLALLLRVALAVMRDASAALAAERAAAAAAAGGAWPATHEPAGAGAALDPEQEQPDLASGRRRTSSSSGGGGGAGGPYPGPSTARDHTAGRPARLGLTRGPPEGASPLPALAAAVGALRLAVEASAASGRLTATGPAGLAAPDAKDREGVPPSAGLAQPAMAPGARPGQPQAEDRWGGTTGAATRLELADALEQLLLQACRAHILIQQLLLFC